MRGDHTEAEREYREALRLNPKLENAFSGLGLVLSKRNNHRDAIKAFKAALKIREDPKIHNNLGCVFVEIAKSSPLPIRWIHYAKKEFKRATEMEKTYVDAHRNLTITPSPIHQ
ncbi:MAG: tetratricopeptide repeat protein [Candidatus Syntropharchaeia archaeon]